MITLKLKIKNKIDLTNYIKQYNNVKRFSYNRFCDGEEIKRINLLCKDLNNIDLLDASIIECAVFTAQDVFKTRGEGVIFGGKKLFNKLKYKKILDKTEYQNHRDQYLRIIGKANQYGNRKFNFDLINNKLTFKPKFGVKFEIEFENPSSNQRELLDAAQLLADQKLTPITVSISNDHVLLGIDETIIQKSHKKDLKKNRILSIDSNPQFVGVSIIDWREDSKKVIHKEVIDLRGLSNCSTNKRTHETYQVSKRLADLAREYRCEIIGVEQLTIKNKDHKKGKIFNRKVNNIWNRIKFFNNLKKWCNIYSIKFVEILPQYSSFIGSLLNDKEPDMIAAAIEIGRRSYLFNKVYLTKEISPFQKNGKKVEIIFPKFNSSELSTRWKEMIANDEKLNDWKKLFDHIKKSKLSYRFLFDDWIKSNRRSSSRLKSRNSNVYVYFS